MTTPQSSITNITNDLDIVTARSNARDIAKKLGLARLTRPVSQRR